MQPFLHWKNNLIEFNVFRTHTTSDDDPHQKSIQLISTRLFIFLVVTSLAILVIYMMQVSNNVTNTMEHPSLTTYLILNAKYGDALICPCTNIAIERHYFLTITPIFHQVCSSDFVEEPWLNYLRSASSRYVSTDFRFTGSVLFTILASFCRLANETINDSLPSFYSTQFVSSKVINQKHLNDEIESIIDLYVSTSSNAFAQSFELIRDMTFTDGLVSGLQTNFRYTDLTYSDQFAVYVPTTFHETYGQCSCESSPSCIAPAMILNIFIVPGLYIGCYLLEAMRQSNLVCLYNQTCLDQLSIYLQSPVNFTSRAMVTSNTSRFDASTMISEILSLMMVESWMKNSSYQSYFQNCQPSSCSYTVSSNNGFAYILTSILGIIGGLSKGLLMIVPVIVALIMNRCRRRKMTSPCEIQLPLSSNREPKSTTKSISTLARKVSSRISAVNLFRSYPPSVDPHELKTERLATIVFIISLVFSILILLFYTAIQHQIESIHIDAPSLDEYYHLYEKYSTDGLSCPCSKISNEYGQMIELTPVYHEYCSSDFVTDTWLSYKGRNSKILYTLDLRRSASLLFHSLASYCSLSQRKMSNQLRIFQSTSMISSTLLSEMVFNQRMSEAIIHFTQAAGQNFIQLLEFVQINTYGNQLYNGMMTNADMAFQQLPNHGQYIVTSIPSTKYMYCGCNISPECTANAAFFRMNSSTITEEYRVPGILIGCYNNEALRKSTFECFYNISCVKQLKTYLNINTTQSRLLKSSRLTSFDTSTTIQIIIANLMIDRWISNISYPNYFQTCQPSYCTYKIIRRTPLIVIVTTLLGLFGGLLKIFKIIVPRFVHFLRRRPPSNVDLRPRLIRYKEKISGRIRTFNLFRTKTPLDEQIDQLRIQIISTRLFIITFTFSIVILLSYTSQSEVMKSIRIELPTLSTYLSFFQRHGDEIICPCSNMVNIHGNFVSLVVKFHQICSSDFINHTWAATVLRNFLATPISISMKDFRSRSPYYFLSLAAICNLTKRITFETFESFYTDTLITPELLSQSIFLTQINATIDLLRSSMINNFVRSFRVLRHTNYGSGLVSGSLSSFTSSFIVNGTLLLNDSATWQINFEYNKYNSSRCSCRETSDCVEQSYIYSSQKKNE